MFLILKIFINILILGLFLYSKLLPYKDKLDGNFRIIFEFFNKVYSPIFNFLKQYIKPLKVGTGLSVDMTQIILLLFLLLLNNFF